MKSKQNRKRIYRRRMLRRYGRYLLIAIIVVILAFDNEAVHSLFSNRRDRPSYVNESNETKEPEEIIFAIRESDEDTSEDGTEWEGLYSPYMILIDLESGESLAEHNANVRIYPASLTKIMTAILAIEYTENMEEFITLSPGVFQNLYEENASVAGFEADERISLRDLLYGMLLPSGAECCVAFADRIAGSENAFVELMNQKAESLGMVDTHFCNSTGLHHSEHYTTVKDLSILLQYALKNETFKEVFTCRAYTTVSSKQHPEGITFYSTLFVNMDDPEIMGGEILGGKTGYTAQAGLCLASMARLDDKEYILVTAKAEGNWQTEPFHILDAKNAYNRIYMRIILHSMMPHLITSSGEKGI